MWDHIHNSRPRRQETNYFYTIAAHTLDELLLGWYAHRHNDLIAITRYLILPRIYGYD